MATAATLLMLLSIATGDAPRAGGPCGAVGLDRPPAAPGPMFDRQGVADPGLWADPAEDQEDDDDDDPHGGGGLIGAAPSAVVGRGAAAPPLPHRAAGRNVRTAFHLRC